MTKLLYGTDPEMFSVYEKHEEQYAEPPVLFRRDYGVPAEKIDTNHPEFLHGDGWTMMEDGAAWEMTIRPSHNPEELFERIQECKRVTERNILSQFPDKVLPELQFLPTVGWEVDRFLEEDESFYMATRFGCDPSLDAFNPGKLSETVDATNHPFRYSGGHLHISGSEKFLKEPILAVKFLAMTIGNASIAYTDTPGLDLLRANQYGNPGNYRPQEYGLDNPYGAEYAVGIEYRTLSSRWLGNLDIARKIFHWAEVGVKTLLETSLGLELLDELETPTVESIVNVDQEKARQILEYIESKI